MAFWVQVEISFQESASMVGVECYTITYTSSVTIKKCETHYFIGFLVTAVCKRNSYSIWHILEMSRTIHKKRKCIVQYIKCTLIQKANNLQWLTLNQNNDKNNESLPADANFFSPKAQTKSIWLFVVRHVLLCYSFLFFW